MNRPLQSIKAIVPHLFSSPKDHTSKAYSAMFGADLTTAERHNWVISIHMVFSTIHSQASTIGDHLYLIVYFLSIYAVKMTNCCCILEKLDLLINQ